MIIEACYCNWGIPGVEALPAHHHPASPNDTYEPGSVIEGGLLAGQRRPRLVRDPNQEPCIWLDWKALSRSALSGATDAPPSTHVGPVTVTPLVHDGDQQ